ncbi:hypothetical protein Brsp04_01593 [Brucella sp. NBRC 12952]
MKPVALGIPVSKKVVQDQFAAGVSSGTGASV